MGFYWHYRAFLQDINSRMRYNKFMGWGLDHEKTVFARVEPQQV